MSSKVTGLVVSTLRNVMFPALPTDLQKLFPQVKDPFAPANSQALVPNIMPGQYNEYGANAGMILITVDSYGPLESLTEVYRHLTVAIDIWVSAANSPNVDGRRILEIIYEYVRRTIQERNYSGKLVSIQRSYELTRSEVMFEPTNKIYHLNNVYRVEAVSATWY